MRPRITTYYYVLYRSAPDDFESNKLNNAGKMSHPDDQIQQAAKWISDADALIIATGAGMGVDSGLPTYRGPSGFANAYPVVQQLGLSYRELATPAMLDRDPYLAWGFHALFAKLFRTAEPHLGFSILRRWVQRKAAGGFVYTSNVDGHFQRAGFDAQLILECHGTTVQLQCSVPCTDQTWDASTPVAFIESTMRAVDPLPRCGKCGALARPNVRLFSDPKWVGRRTHFQSNAFERWKAERLGKKVVIIECGAGKAVPAVRLASELAMLQLGATLIRINPVDTDVPTGQLSIALGAKEALERIDGWIF